MLHCSTIVVVDILTRHRCIAIAALALVGRDTNPVGTLWLTLGHTGAVYDRIAGFQQFQHAGRCVVPLQMRAGYVDNFIAALVNAAVVSTNALDRIGSRVLGYAWHTDDSAGIMVRMKVSEERGCMQAGYFHLLTLLFVGVAGCIVVHVYNTR